MVLEIITVAVQNKSSCSQATRDDPFFLHHDSLEGSRDFSAGRWLFPEELKEVHVEKMGGNSSWVSFYLSPKRKALKPFAKKSTHTRYKSWWCDRAKSFWHPSSPFSSFSFSGYTCVSSCVGTPKDGRQCLNYRSVCVQSLRFTRLEENQGRLAINLYYLMSSTSKWPEFEWVNEEDALLSSFSTWKGLVVSLWRIHHFYFVYSPYFFFARMTYYSGYVPTGPTYRRFLQQDREKKRLLFLVKQKTFYYFVYTWFGIPLNSKGNQQQETGIDSFCWGVKERIIAFERAGFLEKEGRRLVLRS